MSVARTHFDTTRWVIARRRSRVSDLQRRLDGPRQVRRDFGFVLRLGGIANRDGDGDFSHDAREWRPLSGQPVRRDRGVRSVANCNRQSNPSGNGLRGGRLHFRLSVGSIELVLSPMQQKRCNAGEQSNSRNEIGVHGAPDQSLARRPSIASAPSPDLKEAV